MLEEFPALSIKIEEETLTCSDLIKCMFRLSDTETVILQSIEEVESLTAQEISKRINRDRATAYRGLEKLVAVGLMHKERRGREGRGYSNYYRKMARKDILKKSEMKLDRCYTAIKNALMTFS